MLTAINRNWKSFRRSAAVGFASAAGTAAGFDMRACRSLIRQVFTDYLDPSCRVLVDRGTHRFIVDPRDTQVGFELMRGNDWQRQELSTAIALLRAADRLQPGTAFIDVGANIGTQTVYAFLDGDFARGVAIEAEAQNFALLVRNIEMNGLAERAQAFHLAASDKAGTIKLAIDKSNAGGHMVAVGPSSAQLHEVAAKPVDTIIADAGLEPTDAGLVWIDVEGHEMEVLAGMTNLLATGVPLVVEFNGTNHGPKALSRLRTAIGQRYSTVAVLNAKGLGAAQGPMPLAAFVAPPSTRDLLIY